MAQRFSLKDNPIFQKFVPHTSLEPSPPLEDTQKEKDAPYEDKEQNLTVRERPSYFDTQNTTADNENHVPATSVDADHFPSQEPIQPCADNNHEEKEVFLEEQNLTVRERLSETDIHNKVSTLPDSFSSSQITSAFTTPTRGSSSHATSRDSSLRDHYDKALFFGFYNEVADELLPTFPPAAQVLYNRLFRLSYGFNRNYCTVSQPLLMERTNLSRNTLRTALQLLIDGGWISIIGAGNRVSTTYRVILPREKHTREAQIGSKIDPQRLTVKNRPSTADGQNKSLIYRGADFDAEEGQKPDRQILIANEDNVSKTQNSGDLQHRPSNFDAQDLPPLLFTNRSSTLPIGDSERQRIPTNSLLLSARELTDKFYSLLGLRVAKSKRKKSLDECVGLLQEGFTAEEIDYAISWLIAHHPTTGSFSRLPHFIDQALKVYELQKRTPHNDTQGVPSVEDVQHRRQKEQEEAHRQQRIEAIIASLAPEKLVALREEAEKRVEHEYPDIKFGRDTLVRLTLEESITAQFLSQVSEHEEK